MGVRFLPRPRERRSSPTGGPGPGSGSCRWARGWEFHSNSREKLGGFREQLCRGAVAALRATCGARARRACTVRRERARRACTAHTPEQHR